MLPSSRAAKLLEGMRRAHGCRSTRGGCGLANSTRSGNGALPALRDDYTHNVVLEAPRDAARTVAESRDQDRGRPKQAARKWRGASVARAAGGGPAQSSSERTLSSPGREPAPYKFWKFPLLFFIDQLRSVSPAVPARCADVPRSQDLFTVSFRFVLLTLSSHNFCKSR